jgi:hypothetical protein
MTTIRAMDLDHRVSGILFIYTPILKLKRDPRTIIMLSACLF